MHQIQILVLIKILLLYYNTRLVLSSCHHFMWLTHKHPKLFLYFKQLICYWRTA